MSRLTACIFGLGLALFAIAAPDASARRRSQERHLEKPTAAEKAGGDEAGGAKPVLLGTFGEWEAYRTQKGKSKVCYAFAKPKERQPSGHGRDPSYVLVSTRPGDHVRNEVSVIMGLPLKDGTIDEGADVNGSKFDLVAKGQNAWVKTAAEEAKMVDIMRRGSRLLIKAASARGKTTTDLYLLDGVTQALDKVAKECR